MSSRRLDQTLWTVLLVWLYGTPFLLVVGLVRRSATVDFLPDSDAYRSAAESIILAGLALGVLVPLAGIGVAAKLGRSDWVRRFFAALVAEIGIALMSALTASYTVVPLLRHRG
jgi:hypothetical protein